MAKKKNPLPEINPDAILAWANDHAKEITQASDAFYLQYGKTLDGWSCIEGSLSQVFAKLTQMPAKRAARIFYSARSFNGRADMFEAALDSVRLAKEVRAFLKTVIKIANTYSGFRNKLAHGEPNLHLLGYDPDGKPQLEMLITEPKLMEQSGPEFGLGLDALKQADTLFRALAYDITRPLNGERGPSLEKRRELILQRPKLPRSTAAS